MQTLPTPVNSTFRRESGVVVPPDCAQATNKKADPCEARLCTGTVVSKFAITLSRTTRLGIDTDQFVGSLAAGPGQTQRPLRRFDRFEPNIVADAGK